MKYLKTFIENSELEKPFLTIKVFNEKELNQLTYELLKKGYKWFGNSKPTPSKFYFYNEDVYVSIHLWFDKDLTYSGSHSNTLVIDYFKGVVDDLNIYFESGKLGLI